MLWDTPVYRFRISISEESEFLKEVVFDVTGSAPSFTEVKDTMRGVWDSLLNSADLTRITSVLDFGAAKFRNTLYFLNKGKKVAAVEFEDLPKKSEDARAILDKCEGKKGFQHLIFPQPFITNPEKYDLVLLVNVLPVMPVFAERLLVLDLLYDKVNDDKYVLWYAQHEGEYRSIRESGKNDFGDGLWMGTKKRFKTFYKYHNVDDVLEMFALYGFQYLRKFSAPGNDVLLFQKTKHSLFHDVITPEKIEEAIPRDDTIEAPEVIKIRRVKETDLKKEIIPNPSTLAIQKLYSDTLRKIPTGKENAERYHRLISQIILRIFRGSLRNMELKVDMFKGLRVIDTVYSNAGGFFSRVATTFGIPCPYILLEAKNYTFDIENPEFDQITSRLIDDVGKFGLLVCRKADDKDAVKRHCEAILQDGKTVIVLTDEEILNLLELSFQFDTDEIDDIMDRKIRSIRFRS